MTYFLGKDVNIYITTEMSYAYLSGTTDGDGSSWVATNSGLAVAEAASQNLLVYPRTSGMLTPTELADVTGIDFTPGAMNEDIAYMGKNTHLSAQVKHELSATITKKKNDGLWDKLFNQRARDGCYANSGGAVVADAGQNQVNADVTFNVHDGLTTSRLQNFGYRIFLQLKDATETFVLRNCCMTSHTVTLAADGTQEETVEFYSYVKPYLVTSNAVGVAGDRIYATGLTTMADI